MSNPVGQSRTVINFGLADGTPSMDGPFGIGQSEDFSDLGGKWVKQDGSGYIDALDGSGGGGDTSILGWAYISGRTSTANYATYSADADGDDECMVDTSCETEYWMPADSNTDPTIDMVGKTCDTVTTSKVQYADLDSSTSNTLIITDVDTTNKYVKVKQNPSVHRGLGGV